MNQAQPLTCFSLRRSLTTLFVIWFCFKVGGWFVRLPSPWGPQVGGHLPNGSEIYFQARKVGGETDDRLLWTPPGRATCELWVDQVHNGFAQVTIKFTNNGDRVWVESNGKVGASLDLITCDFRPERDTQHPWARLGTGQTLAAGKTGSLLWAIGPW